MKITLIQIDLIMGARILLSVLREIGYDAKLLQINVRYIDTLTQDDLHIIYEYVKDSDIVGLSFNTFYTLVAEQLAFFLKAKGIKYIIAGGNHATALPGEVVVYSDVVIKYEAEITLPRVLEALRQGEGLSGIKGIVYKHNNKVVGDKSAPEIVWELDKIPFQSIDTSLMRYFNPRKKLYKPEKWELFSHDKNCYYILATRGCPFSCTFCANSLYHALDKRFKTVRKRSINNILSEMEFALHSGFTSFYIADDHFFSFSLEEIRLFSNRYKRDIKIPFSIVGLNPNNFKSSSTEEKLALLIDCGLTDVRIGVQSGSNKTLDIFKRGYKAEDIPDLLAPIERHRNTIWGSPYDRLHVALDFICDAIWETKEDKIATIKLAQKALAQYSIFFYTLIYLPGTEIYNQALKNKWIFDNVRDIYLRGIAGVDDNIYNRLLFLIAVTKERSVTIPEKLIDHIIELSQSDEEMAKELIDSIMTCINGIEKYHKVNLNHAALHPYLTGFNEWQKSTGKAGKKVLFRSYHEPYG